MFAYKIQTGDPLDSKLVCTGSTNNGNPCLNKNKIACIRPTNDDYCIIIYLPTNYQAHDILSSFPSPSMIQNTKYLDTIQSIEFNISINVYILRYFLYLHRNIVNSNGTQ